MKREWIASVSSLLFPLGMYTVPAPAAGSYQRSYLRAPATDSQLPLPSSRPTPLTDLPRQPPSATAQLELQSGRPVSELVVIGASVPDKQLFYRQLKPGQAVVEIVNHQDGLQQLTDQLAAYRQLDALHIISHAESGVLHLGDRQIDAVALRRELQLFSRLNQALKPGGDVFFYGCNLAAGGAGEAFLDIVQANTHVDVAASNDLTGHADLGGDWELEIQRGSLGDERQFSAVALQDFADVLQFSGTLNLDNIPVGGYAAKKSYTVPTTGYDINFASNGGGGSDLYNGASGYIYVGTGGSSGGHTATNIYFTNNETFSLTSLYVHNGSGSPRVISFTSNKGGTEISSPLGQNQGETVNFSGANWIDIDNLQIKYNDNSQLDWTLIDTIVIANLSPANSAPVATAPPAPFVIKDDTNVALSDDIQVADADAGDTQTLTFTITGGTVTLGTTGILFGGSGNSSSSFTAQGSLTEINNALDAATFTPTPDLSGFNAGTIAFIANDGADNSSNASVTFSIIELPPTVTSATYNAGTGELVVTGTDFSASSGAGNDVDVTKLTVTGEAGGTRTLASSANVEISSATSFTVPLGATDRAAVDALLNANGTQADDATTYNLAAADDFITAVTAGDTADLTGNGITVSGVVVLDSDGSLSAAATVTEPVAINTTITSAESAVDVLDFTLSDGGTSDGFAMTVSQLVVNVSGTSSDTQRGNITWRLNGNDADNIGGVYNAGADTITFGGLAISIADGASEIYTVNAYYNDNTDLDEGTTYILSVDGDTDVTVGGAGTQMGTTSPIDNSTGSTVDVTATNLTFTTQPAGSVSGAALTTQPVVTARDDAGNTDTDFTEIVTLTEGSAGSLTNNTAVGAAGVATFSGLTYDATEDQESFALTADDQAGVGSDLPTVASNGVTSDVVATTLVFVTQPAPLSVLSGVTTNFTTVPVVEAQDANGVVDTGMTMTITLSEVNGAGAATITGTGDTDADSAIVSLAATAGVATFTGLNLTYTASGAANENFNLRASSGGLATADSSQLTAIVDDVDGTLQSADGVNEPVALSFSADAPDDAVELFDFTFTDGGSNDGNPMTISAIRLNVSGTSTDAERAQITWRLSGADADNVPGTYDAGADTVTFAGLSLSVADGASETYAVNAYFNDNTSVIHANTVILAVDGDTDVTLGAGTKMASTSAVTNATGTVLTDDIAPVVSEVTAVMTPTNDPAPNVVVQIDEAGTLAVGGSCGSAAEGAITAGAAVVVTLTGTDNSSDLTSDVYADCTVTVTDTAGNASAPLTLTSFTVDADAPTVTISGVPANTYVSFTATFQFSEAVTGFELGDIALGNATASGFAALAGNAYTALITPTDIGLVTIDVAGGAAVDGVDTDNTAATQAVANFDNTAPAALIPLDLSLGDTFFIAFVSSATLNACDETSTTIRAFGDTAAAEGNTATAAINGWTPLFAHDDGTNTTAADEAFGGVTGRPVYLVDGTKVADDRDDMLDGTLDAAIDLDQAGNAGTGSDSPFTGFDADGSVNNGLDNGGPCQVGDRTAADVRWAAIGTSTVAESMYVLSPLLVAPDVIAPTVTISGVPASTNAAFTATFLFGEAVTGFALEDITLGNAMGGSFTALGASAYTVLITPTAAGSVTIDVNAGVATDAAGNGNMAAAQAASEYDLTGPTVAIQSVPVNTNSAFTATFQFSEPVAGFTIDDIALGNAVASNFTVAADDTYTALIGPSLEGVVTIDVNGSVATDAAGNDNTAATQAIVNFDITAPTLSIALSDTDLLDGETADVTFTFSETPVDFTEADVTAVENGSIGDLAVDPVDDKIYIAVLTPVANLTDLTNTLVVLGSGYTDPAGNTGIGAASPNYQINSTSVNALTEVQAAAAADDASAVTADDLNEITGVSGAVFENEADYQTAIAAADPEDVDTPAEIQALIDAINEMNNRLFDDGFEG